MSPESEHFLRLGRALAAEQDRELSQDLSLGSVRTRVVSRPPRRRSKLRSALVAGAVVAAAAAVALLVGVGRRQGALGATFGGHPLSVGEWVSATEADTPAIRFSDGSEVSLSAGSRARLVTLDSVGAHLVLESGAADVRVVPNHGARYKVSLGPFAVDVTGTRFDVGFRPSDELFTLTLREGKVVVSGCVLGEGRTLLAGESLRASCRAGHFEISAAGERPSAGNAAAPSALPVEPSPEPSRPPDAEVAPRASREAPPPSWQSLSRQSRFADAYALIELVGFDAAVAKSPVSELALLGDTARFAGKPKDALTAYRALRSRAPGSPGAGLAAFSMARVHFDQQAAYADAARWFRTYLAEQPGGPFAREAEGRLMEALSRSGDRSGAQSAARGYLERYPRGPHERVARQLLSR